MAVALRGALKGYLRLLEKYPLRMMSTTTATLMTAGDVISQLVIERKGLKGYDPIRSGRFTVIGFCIVGPMIRTWFLGLDRLYTGTKYAAFKMVATDQAMMSPTFLVVFFSSMGLLKGESPAEIKEKLRQNFVPVLTNNYKLWPMVQFINFQFVPLQHRVLVVNCVSLFWNVYLAWVSEKNDKEEEEEDGAMLALKEA